jgi:nitrite reductase/ring-hydroxylating ferredoxin subunit
VKQKICDLSSLSEQSCREFTVQNAAQEKDAFLVYVNQQCYAYENSCPHTGVNLNWQKEQFFSLDGLFLECCMHGALFEPETGLCVRGPCQGSNLKPINIVIDNESVYVSE